MKSKKNSKIANSYKNTIEKRKLQECKVYELKIDKKSLSDLQLSQIKMLFVESKWLWNDILNWSKTNNKPIYKYIIGKKITKYNKDANKEIITLNFIKESHKQCILQQMTDCCKALKRLKTSGHKIGILKFRSEINCINFKQFGVTHKIKNNRIKLQGIKGYLKIFGLKQIPKDCEFANFKLIKKASGYYIKATTFKFKSPKVYLDSIIGLDFGIKDSITVSDGRKFNIHIEEDEQLKKLSRKFNKKQLRCNNKNSNNMNKLRTKLQKKYEKLTNKKNDLANKIVHELTQYKIVYMQNENIAGWHKGWFGKQIQHSCLGTIKSKLSKHDNVIILDKWLPTTKLCPSCGCLNKHSLDKRIYKCDCGYSQDRDIHSAKNMILLGQELTDFKLMENKTSASNKFLEASYNSEK